LTGYLQKSSINQHIAAHDILLWKGGINAFSALVGVILQDINEPLSGELVVVPGGHKNLARIYGQSDAGYEHLLKNGENGLEVAKREQDESKSIGDTKNRCWKPPFHVIAKAGDVVIINWMLPHLVAPNTSPDIRYCIYFRVFTNYLVQEDFSKMHKRVSIALPFHDWAGMPGSCPQRGTGQPCRCLEMVRIRKRQTKTPHTPKKTIVHNAVFTLR